jgi:hypothetical protein
MVMNETSSSSSDERDFLDRSEIDSNLETGLLDVSLSLDRLI